MTVSKVPKRADSRGHAPRRLSAEERRAQIIDVAIGRFGRHGFKGTTTKALAEAAGVSEATIFKYFPTKADLHAAAFEHRTLLGTSQLVTELQEYVDDGDDEGMLRRLCHGILKGYEIDRDLHRLLLYAFLEQDLEANRHLSTQLLRSPLFDFLAGYVRRRQSEGRFRDAPPGLMVAMLLHVPVHEAIQTKLYGLGSGFSDDVVAETYARLTLDGLQTPRQA